jgi:hypothetical protein
MMFVKVIGFIVKVVRGVIKMFTSVKEGLQMGRDGFMGLIDGILWPFRWLYDVLVGHSIVPDLVEGIVMWFLKLPNRGEVKALGGLIVGIAEWIWGHHCRSLCPILANGFGITSLAELPTLVVGYGTPLLVVSETLAVGFGTILSAA